MDDRPVHCGGVSNVNPYRRARSLWNGDLGQREGTYTLTPQSTALGRRPWLQLGYCQKSVVQERALHMGVNDRSNSLSH